MTQWTHAKLVRLHHEHPHAICRTRQSTCYHRAWYLASAWNEHGEIQEATLCLNHAAAFAGHYRLLWPPTETKGSR